MQPSQELPRMICEWRQTEECKTMPHRSSCCRTPLLPLVWCPDTCLWMRHAAFLVYVQTASLLSPRRACAGYCWLYSSAQVHRLFTSISAEDMTKVYWQHRHVEEWQRQCERHSSRGLFCQERNYCKSTHPSVHKMGARWKIWQPGLVRSKERRGEKKSFWHVYNHDLLEEV